METEDDTKQKIKVIVLIANILISDRRQTDHL